MVVSTCEQQFLYNGFPECTNRNDCLDHFLLSSCLGLRKKRAASQTCFEKEGSFVQKWHEKDKKSLLDACPGIHEHGSCKSNGSATQTTC